MEFHIQPNLPVIIGILLLSMEVLRPVGKTNEKCFFFFFIDDYGTNLISIRTLSRLCRIDVSLEFS